MLMNTLPKIYARIRNSLRKLKGILSLSSSGQHTNNKSF